MIPTLIIIAIVAGALYLFGKPVLTTIGLSEGFVDKIVELARLSFFAAMLALLLK